MINLTFSHRVEHIFNALIILLLLILVLFLEGGQNDFLARKMSRSETTLKAQYNERIAYSKFLNQIDKERAFSAIRYLPPPTIVSLNSLSNQYFFEANDFPIFSADEDLTIEGLAAPNSRVVLVFEPGGLAFSDVSSKEGGYAVTIPANTLSRDTYQLFIEGKIDQASSGLVRKMDLVIKKPIDRNDVLLYGSLGLILFMMLFMKFFIGGESVKVKEE